MADMFLLQHALETLPPGGSVQLDLRGVHCAAALPSLAAGSSGDTSATAAAWGLLRVAATERKVGLGQAWLVAVLHRKAVKFPAMEQLPAVAMCPGSLAPELRWLAGNSSDDLELLTLVKFVLMLSRRRKKFRLLNSASLPSVKLSPLKA